MEEQAKPKATWQTWDGNTLTVHVSSDPNSEIYFQGKPEDYDGTATEPASPTSEYIAKHKSE